MYIKETVIILVNYNGYNDTRECLISLKQIPQQPYIIIVDNASKDADQLEELKSVITDLNIIYNQENIGFGRANNVGIRWAQENIQFDYLCLLNNDTVVTPDFLEHLKQPFAKDPKIGITTGKIFYESDRDIIWYGGGEINYTRGWPKIDDYNQVPTTEGANTSKYVSFISGCLMLFTKDSIAKLKGFDEEFFMYCEDLELCLRAKAIDMKLYYNSNSRIYHKVQGSLKKTEPSKTGLNPKNPNLKFLFFNLKKNQYTAFKKHLYGWSFIKFYTYYKLHITYLSFKFFLYGRFEIIRSYFKLMSYN